MQRPEEQIHRACVEYLRLCVPEARDGGPAWFHPPNGGGRSKAEAGVFKALGVRPGVPDICLVFRGKLFGIEVKGPDGRVSKAQRERRDEWRAAGASYEFVRSLDEFRSTLQWIGVPTKEAA